MIDFLEMRSLYFIRYINNEYFIRKIEPLKYSGIIVIYLRNQIKPFKILDTDNLYLSIIELIALNQIKIPNLFKLDFYLTSDKLFRNFAFLDLVRTLEPTNTSFKDI